MRAVQVTAFGPVAEAAVLVDLPTPEPGRGEVRVGVAAAAIGFVDRLKIEGRYQTRDPLPFVPGSEFAGVIERASPEAPDLPSGAGAGPGRRWLPLPTLMGRRPIQHHGGGNRADRPATRPRASEDNVASA